MKSMNLTGRRLSRIIATAAVLVGMSVCLGGCDRGAGEAPPPSEDQTTPSGSAAGGGAIAGGLRKDCGSGAGCPFDSDHPVPDVVGMTVQEAVRMLHGDDYGCVIAAEGSDDAAPRRVVAQKPEPGSGGSGTRWVHLTVSKPFPHPPGRLPVACGDQRETSRSLFGENLSGGRKLAPRSRTNVGQQHTTLRKGELALSVPRLGLKDVTVPGGSTQAELDREGIVRLESSGLPWYEGSNTFIAGHRLGFLRTKLPYVFYELDEMRPGDEIFVEDPSGREYVYEVYDYMTVRPEDYWVTYPVDGKTIISLQTCDPIPSFENRLVVRAELMSASS